MLHDILQDILAAAAITAFVTAVLLVLSATV
ncbi:hypothetical protein L611_001200000880 [Aminobacter sp. J15]|nr:hypothetical protein L611_001200000880 [Aminobacter sp. J15]